MKFNLTLNMLISNRVRFEMYKHLKLFFGDLSERPVLVFSLLFKNLRH